MLSELKFWKLDITLSNFSFPYVDEIIESIKVPEADLNWFWFVCKVSLNCLVNLVMLNKRSDLWGKKTIPGTKQQEVENQLVLATLYNRSVFQTKT